MHIAKIKRAVTRIIAMNVAKRQRIALFKNGALSGLLYAVGGTSWPPTVVDELRIQAAKVLRPGAGKRGKGCTAMHADQCHRVRLPGYSREQRR